MSTDVSMGVRDNIASVTPSLNPNEITLTPVEWQDNTPRLTFGVPRNLLDGNISSIIVYDSTKLDFVTYYRTLGGGINEEKDLFIVNLDKTIGVKNENDITLTNFDMRQRVKSKS